MQHRAVAAVREWNQRLGSKGVYLVCSHGDVIKAIVADALGLHLDQFQRITADPAALTVIRYAPLRPFLLRLNDMGDLRLPEDSEEKDGEKTSPGAMPPSAAGPEPRKVRLCRSSTTTHQRGSSPVPWGNQAHGSSICRPGPRAD